MVELKVTLRFGLGVSRGADGEESLLVVGRRGDVSLAAAIVGRFVPRVSSEAANGSLLMYNVVPVGGTTVVGSM